MSTISKEIKNKVIMDWGDAFPELYIFSTNKIFKVLGPYIIGIEIVPVNFDSNKYIPVFSCYPLWLNDEKECILRKNNLMYREISNEKNLQFFIPYLRHDDFFEEAISCTRRQIQIALEGDVDLTSMIDMIDCQLNDPWVQVAFWPKSQVYNLKFYMALYLNDYRLMEQTIKDLQKTEQEWKPGFIKDFYGSFDQWIENLRNDGNHRDEFLKRIENNRQEKRLKKLHYSELIP